MLLPTTYQSTLLLLVVSLACSGAWANTLKMSGKWRFELYYYDFAWGVLIAAAVAAFTLGSIHPADLTFDDNLHLAGYRKMAWAVAGGCIFNLGNALLVSSVAVAGMTVAFPIAFGTALLVSALWSFTSQSNPVLMAGGGASLIIAVLATAIAHWFRTQDRVAQHPPVGMLNSAPAQKGPAKGIILALAAGLLMGTHYLFLEEARSGDNGVAPYGLLLLFAAGVFLSTLVYMPFFLTFPVKGKPLAVSAYFRGATWQHLLGLLGGAVWLAGGLSNEVARASPAADVGRSASHLPEATAIAAALWGLVLWREFRGATVRTAMALAAMIVLFLTGLGLLAVASASGTSP